MNLYPIYKHLRSVANLCAKLEHRGLKIDVDYMKKMEQKYIKECDKIGMEMIKIYTLEDDFNLNSTQQISKVFKKLGIKTGEKTAKGKMSISSTSLEGLKNKHKFIDDYLKWKEMNTARNNFLTKYQEFLDGFDFIHPTFNPAVIVTGRLACSKPSAQNIPKNPDIKGMFVSRFKGGKLLSCDYKQLEIMLLASEANEKVMLDAIKNHIDIHDKTAEEMFGIGFSKEQRFIAKNINFGSVYGVSDWSLAKQFNVEVDLATRWLDKFKKIYPNVFKWMREQHKFARKNGYVISQFGRVRRLPEAKSDDPYLAGHALRQAGNFPIQSLGADITNSSAVVLDKELIKLKLRSKLVHIIHDAVLIDVYPGEENKVQWLARRVMEKDVPNTLKFLKVELKISQELSRRWGNKDE